MTERGFKYPERTEPPDAIDMNKVQQGTCLEVYCGGTMVGRGIVTEPPVYDGDSWKSGMMVDDSGETVVFDPTEVGVVPSSTGEWPLAYATQSDITILR